MPDILHQIIQIHAALHSAGTVSAPALRAIAEHAAGRRIVNSVETGCGATTLLLSHLSQNHTVFALDIGGSLSSTRNSSLLRPGVVTFIEGPAQRTLAAHHFDTRLQLALIDGAHAYPFPDLEYYFLYPHLDPGALLIVDDIHIPSIHNLFEFLRRDDMFRLETVVRATALFTRTDAPVHDPLGDGWEQQGYNRRTLWRYDWRSRLSRMLPRGLVAAVRDPRRPTLASFETPDANAAVPALGKATGTAQLPAGSHLWVLAHRQDVEGWWPQGGGPVQVSGGQWSVEVSYGDPGDAGHRFEIAAVVVSSAIDERWRSWVRTVEQTGLYPPVPLPSGAALLSISRRTVRRENAAIAGIY